MRVIVTIVAAMGYTVGLLVMAQWAHGPDGVTKRSHVFAMAVVAGVMGMFMSWLLGLMFS